MGGKLVGRPYLSNLSRGRVSPITIYPACAVCLYHSVCVWGGFPGTHGRSLVSTGLSLSFEIHPNSGRHRSKKYQLNEKKVWFGILERWWRLGIDFFILSTYCRSGILGNLYIWMCNRHFLLFSTQRVNSEHRR